jgi:microcystin-dependent protein
MTGQLHQSIASTFSGALLCDGSTYNQSEHPELAALFGVTSGTFNLPNMLGAVALGASTSNPLKSSGGSATHTLTVGELPSHSHSLVGVSSDGTNTSPTGSALAGGTQIYSESAPTDSLNSASIGSTGSGVPFSIIPPFYAVNYFIEF